KDADYQAFERVLIEAHAQHPTRLLSWCIMPNHFHLVVWPRHDGELTRFMFWLTMTHAQRWRHARGLVGLGPLYQGRFRAFAVQSDGHLLRVIRYVERNPLRAGLVRRAQDWVHGSLHVRMGDGVQAPGGVGAESRRLLSPWPVEEPRDYLEWVNRPQTAAEEEAIRV